MRIPMYFIIYADDMSLGGCTERVRGNDQMGGEDGKENREDVVGTWEGDTKWRKQNIKLKWPHMDNKSWET